MPNMDPKKCPMPSQDPNVRNKNFKEVALGYTAEMAVNEAKRCLNCPKKPCRSASRYRDVLVRRRPGALSAAEVAFINELRREIAGLVQT